MNEHLSALAIHAYYVGEWDVGRRACTRLLRDEHLTPHEEASVRSNRAFYTQRFAELAPATFLRLDIEPAHPGWTLFNPSILAMPEGFLVNVRSSNYRIVDGRYVIPPEDGQRIRTENLLLPVTNDLFFRERTLLHAEYPKNGFLAEGLEDVRLNLVDGRVLASATLRDHAGVDGTCRIGTARLDGGAWTDILVTPTSGCGHEKNWMPILGREQWLYSCAYQGRVATVHRWKDRWRIVEQSTSPKLAKEFRGGSGLVPVGDHHYLALIHEVTTNGGKRVYEHRFVLFDASDRMAIVGISPLFAFLHPLSIEFAAGLAVRGDRLLATFGVRDEEAYLMETSLAAVLSLMEAP